MNPADEKNCESALSSGRRIHPAGHNPDHLPNQKSIVAGSAPPSLAKKIRTERMSRFEREYQY